MTDKNNTTLLSPQELSTRWSGRPTVGTLATWRSTGKGPKFVKLGGGIIKYRLSDVEKYERSRK